MDLHTLCTTLNLDEAGQRAASYAYNLALEEMSVDRVQKSLNLPEASSLRLAMAVRLVESMPMTPTLTKMKSSQRVQQAKPSDRIQVQPAAQVQPMVYGGWNP